MSRLRPQWLFGCLVVLLGATPAAKAQWAVVDVGAIAQLVQQLATMREELETARDQLNEARRQYEAITGHRGMERLLEDTVRNYLPPDWAELEAAVRNASGNYGALAAEIQAAIDASAVLSAEQVAALSPEERAQLQASRQSAAMLQATARQALRATSARFATIQQLVDAIPTAEDQKAILDLQARIAAEEGMLTNEQTKLNSIYQVAQAEEWSRRQRSREQAITGVGSLRRLPPMGLGAIP
jgi:P-type DNA transfer protein VirB5